jgi:3-hydroxy-9,10-secoandrosta-1,3,5(10)-triene-9,17-dione monooxygenase
MNPMPALDVEPILPEVERLAPVARAQRFMTREVVEKLTGVGLFRAMLPRDFGGMELPPVEFFRALIRLAESDMSAAWIGGVVGIHPYQIALMGETALRDVYGQSPDVRVSSSYNPSGAVTATAPGGGLMLSGRWGWSSGCQHSDWLLLGAVAPGDNMVSTCLVPMSSCRIEDTWNSMGLQGTGSNDIVIDQPVRVPPGHIHHQLDGFNCRHGQTSPLYSIPWAQLFSGCVAVPSIGAARHALKLFAANRNPSTVDATKAHTDPDVLRRVAEAAMLIDDTESTFLRNIAAITAAVERGEEVTLEERARCRYYTGSIVSRMIAAVDLLFDAAGGRSVYAGSAIQDIWHDIHITRAHVANNPVPFARNYGNLLLGGENRDFFI